jgi:hypothetical protein
MKASDVVARQTNRERIPVDAALMTRNAKSASMAVDWKRTRIAQTRGDAESPYGRDDADNRRKRFHRLLSRALSEAGYAMDSDETRSLHRLLDEAMDGGELNDDDESESEPEQEQHDDAGIRRASQDSRMGLCYVTDADMISQHLHPNQLCSEAAAAVYDRAHSAQADNSQRSFWTGLVYLLASQPEGARIKDVRQVTLSTLIAKTLAA